LALNRSWICAPLHATKSGSANAGPLRLWSCIAYPRGERWHSSPFETSVPGKNGAFPSPDENESPRATYLTDATLLCALGVEAVCEPDDGWEAVDDCEPLQPAMTTTAAAIAITGRLTRPGHFCIQRRVRVFSDMLSPE
jgi:hypothetical protein